MVVMGDIHTGHSWGGNRRRMGFRSPIMGIGRRAESLAAIVVAFGGAVILEAIRRVLKGERS